MPTLLDATVLADALSTRSLEGWQGDTQHITLAVPGLSDEQSADLQRQVQESADAMDHHPQVARDDGVTTFVLATHSAGGVTELDVALASMINGYVRKVRGLGPTPMPAVAPAPEEYVGEARAEGRTAEEWEREQLAERDMEDPGYGLLTSNQGTPAGWVTSGHEFEPRPGLEPGQDDLR